jgi:hypothetical protein
MPKKPKKEKAFPTEADLCASFIRQLPKGWTPYAECCGWDILLVRDDDGFQIGIQAKLKLNLEVVNQALEDEGEWHATGGNPDCRAVMVPHDDPMRLGKICDYVGLTVIRVMTPEDHKRRYGWHRSPAFSPDLPKREDWDERRWYETAPAKRHALPEYVHDVRAGSASPLQLTAWKIKALKIAVLLEERGVVTRRDFAHLKLDHRRWVASGWLKATRDGYVEDAMPDFRGQHPIVYGQVKADAAKWRPPRSLLEAAPVQAAML